MTNRFVLKAKGGDAQSQPMTPTFYQAPVIAHDGGGAGSLEPVSIRITRHHEYKKKSSGKGCKVCNERQYHPSHLGQTESLNAFLGGRWKWSQAFKGWKEALTLALEQSGLPKGLGHIYVEGRMCFPQKYNKGPDQGNHRVLVEKALGDALEDGGWLSNDRWDMYEFGSLAHEIHPGESWTELMIFPS